MKMIHETNYKLYNSKIKKTKKMPIISDLHFSYKVSDDKLNYIMKYLVKVYPDYILIPGDIIDSVDMILNQNERKRLVTWIKELSQINKVIISLGSHDYTKKVYDKNGKFSWKYYYNKDFFDEISNIDNVYLLDNLKYEDEDICILGYTQSLKSYCPYDKKSIFRNVPEDKKLKLEEINRLIDEEKISDNKLNIFMSHSPIYLTEDEFKKSLKDFDYIISGHMHNGCVPPILYELWKSNKGLIAPNKDLFPSNERNTLLKKDDKLLVNGPLTTFQECTGKMQLFNFLFPYYTSNIIFTDDETYGKQPFYKKEKYIKKI